MNNNDLSIKLVIIGNRKVGKTKIIERYVNENSISTLGVDFLILNIKIKNFNVRLELWDTEDQEKYISYLRNCNGIILVYDITNPNSFNNLNQWLIIISQSKIHPDCEILLLANKLDLNNKRKVNYLDSINFATINYILMFKEISAFEKSNRINNNINENVKRNAYKNCERTFESLFGKYLFQIILSSSCENISL